MHITKLLYVKIILLSISVVILLLLGFIESTIMSLLKVSKEKISIVLNEKKKEKKEVDNF